MRALAAFVRRRRAWLVAAAGAVVVYGALGFLVAPGIVRRQIEERVGKALHRPVTVARVRINPFALSVDIQGFSVKDRDGAPFAGFDELYVDAKLWLLVRKELDFSDVILKAPFARIAIDAKGHLNFEDLLEPGSAADEPESSGGLSIRVDRLHIGEARIAFSDRSRRAPFETTVGPLTLDLQNFRTRSRDNESPYAFSGQTEAGERFAWSGNVFLDPIRSKGTLLLENFVLHKYAPYYQDSTGAEIRSGTVGARASYELEWGPKRRVVRLVDGSLSVRNLELARGAAPPSLSLSEIEVTGATADAFERSAELARVALRGGRVEVLREKDGRLNLVDMMRPPGAPLATAEASGKGSPAPAGEARASPFRYRVGEIALEGIRVDATDEAAPRPVKVAVDLQRLALTDVGSDPAKPAGLELAALVDGKGRVSASGRVFPLAARGEVELEAVAIELAPLGPYLEPSLDVRLDGALVTAKARATFDAGGPEVAWAFRGDVRLDELRVADGRRGEDFLRWKSLRLDGIDAVPGRAALRAVRLQEPRLHLAIWEDGERSLAVVTRQPRSAAGDSGSAPPKAGPAAADPAKGTRQTWSIGTLQVTRGKASFVDRSVKPPAVLDADDIALEVRGLSSNPRSRAEVQASATVGGAPFSVRGTLQPQLLGDATNLAIQSKAIDLTPVGPYVAKYAGYRLEKGKLDLDLRYTVKDRRLTAENLARIDQFTLGDKSDSPDATSLPVKLGLAVLTDRDGVIRLDVPAGGSIDEPDFSIGRMVWQAIGNVFTKVALSPFAALGGLFGGGGGENLDVLEFAPGLAALDAKGEQKLDLLARALRERPMLRMDVEGFGDEALDGPALRREVVRAAVRRAKWSAMHRKDPSLAVEAVVVGADEYPRWLEVAWKALPPPAPAAGSPPGPAPKGPPTVEDMEGELLAAASVPPEAYRELAGRRAEEARARVLGGGIDPGRVFLVEGGERAAKEKGSRVYFTLK